MASIGEVLLRKWPGASCRLGQRVWDDLNILRAATDPGTAGRGGDAVSGAAAPW